MELIVIVLLFIAVSIFLLISRCSRHNLCINLRLGNNHVIAGKLYQEKEEFRKQVEGDI